MAIQDGRWVFGNGNNTPRIARIDLKTFRTAEIIEIPNSGVITLRLLLQKIQNMLLPVPVSVFRWIIEW